MFFARQLRHLTQAAYESEAWNLLMKKNNKVLSVEGTRGVAAFLVILSHLSLTFFPYLHSFDTAPDKNHAIQYAIHDSPFCFFFSGSSAVFIFFGLSGYILSHAAARKLPYQMVGIFLKRYPRLMIPAVASCLLAYVTFMLAPESAGKLTDWIISYRLSDPTVSGAIYSGAFESFAYGQSQYSPVLWTMQLELLGSFLIFGLCFFKDKRHAIAANIISAFLVAAMVYMQIYSAAFALGLLAFLIGNLLQKTERMAGTGLSMVVFIVGLYFAGAHENSTSYSLVTAVFGDQMYLVSNFIAGILIVCSIISSARLSEVFSHRLFVFMGKLSFSVYLIHLPIVYTLGVFSFNEANAFFSYPVSALFACVVIILSSYLAAIAFHAYVDLPATVFSNKLARFTERHIKPQGATHV